MDDSRYVSCDVRRVASGVNRDVKNGRRALVPQSYTLEFGQLEFVTGFALAVQGALRLLLFCVC